MFDTQVLPNKINSIKQKFETGQFADALFAGVNAGNAVMQQRIFTLNEDTLGNSFGIYIGKKTKTKFVPSTNKLQNIRGKKIAGLELTSYQRKRAAAGRQIIKKDLEFSGNLRRSLVTVIKDGKSAAIEFSNKEAAEIAKGQEVQITNIRAGLKGKTTGVGIRIFTLSKQEKEIVDVQVLALIKQELKK